MKTILAAFGAGALFAVGLSASGMTQPAKVVGFLDVTGDWDPTLAFVIGGALLTYALLLPRVLQRDAPLAAARFSVPTRRDITGRLVLGSTLFGFGWGVGGLCPGPALTSLGSASGSIVVFVLAMLFGMWAVPAVERWLERRRSGQRSEHAQQTALGRTQAAQS